MPWAGSRKGSGGESSGSWRMLTSPSGSADQITTGSHWLWESVPWPLPHLHGALYEVQVRPSAGNASVLARSGYFAIKDENPSQVSGPPPQPVVTYSSCRWPPPTLLP